MSKAAGSAALAFHRGRAKPASSKRAKALRILMASFEFVLNAHSLIGLSKMEHAISAIAGPHRDVNKCPDDAD